MRRRAFRLRVGSALCMLALLSATPRDAHAHGLHGHVHVTGWAIENLPAGELRSLFDDPDVFRAALSGAMFPDTGYATDAPGARDYGEAAHWEPFIEPFIQHVRATYGPTYDTKEEKMLVAFLLGCAAHGLQDELFDSTFLFEAEERDGRGQEITDPATDGFLILDGFFRLLPGDFFPIDDVLPVYAGMNPLINYALIAEQIRIVREGYVNDTLGTRIAAGNGRRYRAYIPWTSAHYLDMSVAGSLGAEVEPTAHHMQALWERLNGRFDEANLIVHTWPDAPRRLRSADHTRVASWITFVLGKGIQDGSATGSLVDASGGQHPLSVRYTRWGGTSRVVRFQPLADLVPGATYTVTLDAGATLVDGSRTLLAHQQSIRVDCDVTTAADCEPVVVTDDPTIAPGVATATPTASPSPTTTTSEPTSTATPRATETASPLPSSTVTDTATAVPTRSPTAAATHSPSVTPTNLPTETTLPTATRSATALNTTTPTQLAVVNSDDGSCQMTATPARGSALGSAGSIYVLLGAALLAVRKRLSRRY